MSREGLRANEIAANHGERYKISGLNDLAQLVKVYGSLTLESSIGVNADCGCPCGVKLTLNHVTGPIVLAECKSSEMESSVCMLDVMAICNKANIKHGVY